MTVLTADNSSLILKNLGEMIGSFNHLEIKEPFINGRKTMDALRIQKADNTFVEIRIPGFNGTEIIDEIRKKKKTIRLFMLTFYASGDYQQSAMNAVADFLFSNMDEV
ncbi:MAG: response regulator transcription factor [Bacteroidales bacterium]